MRAFSAHKESRSRASPDQCVKDRSLSPSPKVGAGEGPNHWDEPYFGCLMLVGLPRARTKTR